MNIDPTRSEVRRLFLQRTYDALVEQGEPAVLDPDDDRPEDCAFLTPKGTRCALGIHVPTHRLEAARPAGEEALTIGLDAFLTQFHAYLPQDDVQFLGKVQDCHDSAAERARRAGTKFLTELRTNVHSLAEEYGLSIAT